MSDAPHAPENEDESEIDHEDERRLVRRYHLGAIAEASAGMESALRAIFAELRILVGCNRFEEMVLGFCWAV